MHTLETYIQRDIYTETTYIYKEYTRKDIHSEKSYMWRDIPTNGSYTRRDLQTEGTYTRRETYTGRDIHKEGTYTRKKTLAERHIHAGDIVVTLSHGPIGISALYRIGVRRRYLKGFISGNPQSTQGEKLLVGSVSGRFQKESGAVRNDRRPQGCVRD